MDVVSALATTLWLYWGAATVAVALRVKWPAFDELTSYGRLKARAAAPGLALPMPAVRKTHAFIGFYAVGCAVTTAIIVEGVWRPVVALLVVHLVRRLLECVAVQSMSGSTSLFAAVSGASFYVAVPLTLLVVGRPLDSASKAAVSLCLFAQAVQCWCHFQFEVAKRHAGGKHTSMAGFPFRLVSSPHYTAEIALYVGLASCCGSAIAWMPAAFTALNLAVTAAESRRWSQKQRIPPCSNWNLLPFVF
jgi:hypothetical protein